MAGRGSGISSFGAEELTAANQTVARDSFGSESARPDGIHQLEIDGGTMNDRSLRVMASVGLGVGGALGMAGTFAPSASLRGLAWGIDGIALVMACSLLTLRFFRMGQEIVAAGFLVFAIGESLLVSGAAMDLAQSGPSFGGGVGLWAAGLALISVPRVFPMVARLLGLVAAFLFAATAYRIFAGAQITALSQPLPFFAYPVLVATFVGWIVTILRDSGAVTRPSV
jgi:hypothetical protein